MVMLVSEANHLQNVLVPVIYSCKADWSTKYFWSLKDLPDIREQLHQRITALNSLEDEVRRLYLPEIQVPVLIDYIQAVKRIPEGLVGKINTYNVQRKMQPHMSEKHLFNLYCSQNQSEFDALQHLLLVGTNDISRGLLGYIALNVEGSKTTSQDLRKGGIDKARDWAIRFDANEQIEDKSAMGISHGHWSILEAAATYLEVGDYDIRTGMVIGVPMGHPNTWRFMQTQRLQLLMNYSREIHEKFEHGELSWLKGFRRHGRSLTALDKLCGPHMSIIAVREELNRAFLEIDAIERELKSMKGNPLYDTC